MSWLWLTLLSAVFLGLYDVCKKLSVNQNAVLPVLFLSNLTAGLLWLPWLLWSAVSIETIPTPLLQVQPIGLELHGLLLLKSTLVCTSWVLAYFGVRNLPMSVASPIRSTAPVWTLAGALLILGERPGMQQWLGILVTLGFFWLFSFTGKREGIHFRSNKWVFCMIGATLLGAASALYDKWLFSTFALSAATVQAWFSVYLAVVMVPVVFGWWRSWWPRGEFSWRWTIPLVAVFLLIADFAYFSALGDEDALISVVSVIRRSNVVIGFTAGFVLFKETQFRAKGLCLLGILAGVALILTGS